MAVPFTDNLHLIAQQIVRSEDYIKPREKVPTAHWFRVEECCISWLIFLSMQRPEIKRIEARPVVSEGPKVKLNKVAGESESQSFWDLIKAAARELLTEEETEQFLTALRQVTSYTVVLLWSTIVSLSLCVRVSLR